MDLYGINSFNFLDCCISCTSNGVSCWSKTGEWFVYAIQYVRRKPFKSSSVSAVFVFNDSHNATAPASLIPFPGNKTIHETKAFMSVWWMAFWCLPHSSSFTRDEFVLKASLNAVAPVSPISFTVKREVEYPIIMLWYFSGSAMMHNSSQLHGELR